MRPCLNRVGGRIGKCRLVKRQAAARLASQEALAVGKNFQRVVGHWLGHDV